MAAALICPALPQAAWTAQRRSRGWNVDSSMSDVPVGMSMKPPTCTVAVMCKIGKGGKVRDGLSGPWPLLAFRHTRHTRHTLAPFLFFTFLSPKPCKSCGSRKQGLCHLLRLCAAGHCPHLRRIFELRQVPFDFPVLSTAERQTPPAPRRTKTYYATTLNHYMVERCWKWYPKNIRYTGTPWYTPEINMYMNPKCQKSCKISGFKLMFLGFARTSSLISGAYIGMKPSIHFYNSPRAAAPLRSPNFSGLPSANTMILVGPNAPLLHQLPL